MIHRADCVLHVRGLDPNITSVCTILKCEWIFIFIYQVKAVYCIFSYTAYACNVSY